jgi:hypothetical protein
MLYSGNTSSNPLGSALLVRPYSNSNGTYCMTITGRSGLLSHSITAYLNVGGSGLTISPTSAIHPADATTNTFGVATTGTWTTTVSDTSWITMTTGSGNGNGSAGYSVGANYGNSKKYGSITVSGPSGTQVFGITQNSADTGTPAGSKEYIRLNGRIIAIETK